MAEAERSFRASKLIIIQSLRLDDHPWGQILYDLLKSSPEYNLPTELRIVRRKEDFLELLDLIAEETAATLATPMLHFVMHGSENGVQLTSGEFVSWNELATPLRTINIATGNNLLVTMMACKGLYLEQAIIDSPERSAFWGIIGMEEDYSAFDFTSDFAVFYNEIATTSSLGNALQLIREKGYRVRSTEILFVQAVKLLGESIRGEEKSDFPELRAEFSDKFQERIIKYNGLIPHDLLACIVSDAFKKQISDLHRTYFMLDLFPEHTDRYLSVEQVVAVGMGAEVPES
jgi:hypothetical protein